MDRKYVSLADLSKRFGVSHQTIFNWLAAPHIGLPDTVKIGNRNFFDIAQIEEWEAKNTRRNKNVA